MKDFQGNTPIHTAIICADKTSIEQAIEKYPEFINEVNNVKEAPLHVAAWDKNITAIELLVHAGADIHQKDSKGRDIFHIVDSLVSGSLDIEKTKNCQLWLENYRLSVQTSQKLKM